MDGCDAGDWARLTVGVAGLQVSVSEGEEPPDHSEEHPGAEEGGGEDQEGVLPLQVHHGGENVLQEATLNHTTKPPVSKPSSLFFLVLPPDLFFPSPVTTFNLFWIPAYQSKRMFNR